MSIYLEFPTIEDYPLYSYPFKNDDQLFFPEKKEEEEQAKQERNTIQDYLSLRPI